MPPLNGVRVVEMAPLGGRDADRGEHLDRRGAGLARGQAAVALQPFGDLGADAHRRIERGHRVLEDHRDLAAAQGAPCALVERGEIAPGEPDRAADRARRRAAEQPDAAPGR
jgi:sugar phosphate isomerase/epimerase